MTQKHTPALEHPFNNCGVAPFEFSHYAERLYYPCKNIDGTPNTRVAPIAGGACAHCGTGIRNAYVIRDANGVEFDVGCDCLKKLKIEPKVITAALKEKRKQDKIKRINKEAALVNELKDDYEKALSVLSNKPHPNEWFASQGKTMADYYMFCSQNSKTMKKAIAKADGEQIEIAPVFLCDDNKKVGENE